MKTSTQTNMLANATGNENEALSKVIVIERRADRLAALALFFKDYKLLGYRANRKNILSILKTSIDLGGVFLPELDDKGNNYLSLATSIHAIRPDLPIFLCVEPGRKFEDIPIEVQKAIVGIYIHNDTNRLKELVDTYLFSRHYPSEFISVIKEITDGVLKTAFKEMLLTAEHPYIVKDKVIYGELFSLIPLETNWCRGYMMLQVEEGKIVEAITAKKALINPPEPHFRHVNSILGELSNMIWGGLKNRYGTKLEQDSIGQVRVEVPIIVNHARKYISFGSDDPQLCFKYTLIDQSGELGPITLYQKFIFSLDWKPEKYAESKKSEQELVLGGELELF
jgi:hypothetical protein